MSETDLLTPEFISQAEESANRTMALLDENMDSVRAEAIRLNTDWGHPDWRVNVPEGQWGAVQIERVEIPLEAVSTSIMRCALNPQRQSRLLAPGTFTELRVDGNLWMSDTPQEMEDHKWVFGNATGAVLVNGLGLGMVVHVLCMLPNVTRIDVVEINPDVIRAVRPHYTDPRVRIRHGDAFKVRWPASYRWDLAWHDIWPTISRDNLPQMDRLERRYAKRIRRQQSWKRDMCVEMEKAKSDNWWEAD